MDSFQLVAKYCQTNDVKYITYMESYVQDIFIHLALKGYEVLFKKDIDWPEKERSDIVLKYANIPQHFYIKKYKNYSDILSDDGAISPIKVQEELKKQDKQIVLIRRCTVGISTIPEKMLKSALQKYIRRNITNNAIWAGLEWSLLRCAPAEPRARKAIITNLRNRLKIIYMEDVAIANIDMMEDLDKFLYHIDMNKNVTGFNLEMYVIKAVSLLSQSYHTRMISLLNSIWKVNKHIKHFKNYIPDNMTEDEAIWRFFPSVKKIFNYIKTNANKSDEINLKETLLTQNPVCFYYAQQVTFGDSSLYKGRTKPKFVTKPIIFKLLRDVYVKKKLDVKYVNLAEKWYKEIKNQEAWFCYFIPMLILCFEPKYNGYLPNKVDYSNQWKDLVMYNIYDKEFPSYKHTIESKTSANKGFCYNKIASEDIDEYFEDYIPDIHTEYSIDRGLVDRSHIPNYKGTRLFVEEGAFVDTEYFAKDINNNNDQLTRELAHFYPFSKILTVDGGGYDKAKHHLVENLQDEPPQVRKILPIPLEPVASNAEEESKELEEESKELQKESSDEEEFKEDVIEADIEEEADLFKYVVRAQITTSASKNDSYYAMLKSDYKDFKKGEIVFVKGPYIDDEEYDILKFFIEIKKILGLPYIDMEKIELKMSSRGSFFNEKDNNNKNYIRTKMSVDNVYIFLIFKNLCGNSIIDKKVRYEDRKVFKSIKSIVKAKSSPNWIDTNTYIVDWTNRDNINCKTFDIKTGDLDNPENMLKYALAIYFRYLFGIIDHADRNFIIETKNGEQILYSVDEENKDMNKDSNFIKLSRHFKKIISSWDDLYPKIYEYLVRWEEQLQNIKDILTEDEYIKFNKRFNMIIKNPKQIFIN
jgi:hypothetical protein